MVTAPRDEEELHHRAMALAGSTLGAVATRRGLAMTFSFLEGGYNIRRRHSALGHRSPREFEVEYHPSHKPEPVH